MFVREITRKKFTFSFLLILFGSLAVVMSYLNTNNIGVSIISTVTAAPPSNTLGGGDKDIYRFAFIICTWNYKGALPTLDRELEVRANTLKETLKDGGQFKVVRLVPCNSTREVVLAEFKKFAAEINAAPGKRLVCITLIGHGYQLTVEKNFYSYCPTDAELPKTGCDPCDSPAIAFRQIEKGNRITLEDFRNILSVDGSMILDERDTLVFWIITCRKGFLAGDGHEVRETQESRRDALARREREPGVAKFFSCEKGKLTRTSDADSFLDALICGIAGSADHDDGYVTLEELRKYVEGCSSNFDPDFVAQAVDLSWVIGQVEESYKLPPGFDPAPSKTKYHRPRRVFVGNYRNSDSFPNLAETDIIDFTDDTLCNHDFAGSTFRNVSFRNATLSYGINLYGVTFEDCDLTGLDCRKAKITGTEMVRFKGRNTGIGTIKWPSDGAPQP